MAVYAARAGPVKSAWLPSGRTCFIYVGQLSPPAWLRWGRYEVAGWLQVRTSGEAERHAEYPQKNGKLAVGSGGGWRVSVGDHLVVAPVSVRKRRYITIALSEFEGKKMMPLDLTAERVVSGPYAKKKAHVFYDGTPNPKGFNELTELS